MNSALVEWLESDLAKDIGMVSFLGSLININAYSTIPLRILIVHTAQSTSSQIEPKWNPPSLLFELDSEKQTSKDSRM